MSQEWIAGRNPVLEALKAESPIHHIWIAQQSKGRVIQDVRALAKQRGVKVQEVPKRKLDQKTEGMAHQGVLAFVPPYTYAGLDDLYHLSRQRGGHPFYIILDHIEDPHNVGSIIRTADAVGAHGIIIPKRRAAGVTQVVRKVSAGAIQYVPVAQVTNIAQTIDELKARGVWIFGTDAEAHQDYRQASFDMPVAVVIGSEGKGISRLVREKCDFHVRLPLAGHVTSLNASVAAALLMYEVYRKRNPVQ